MPRNRRRRRRRREHPRDDRRRRSSGSSRRNPEVSSEEAGCKQVNGTYYFHKMYDGRPGYKHKSGLVYLRWYRRGKCWLLSTVDHGFSMNRPNIFAYKRRDKESPVALHDTHWRCINGPLDGQEAPKFTKRPLISISGMSKVEARSVELSHKFKPGVYQAVSNEILLYQTYADIEDGRHCEVLPVTSHTSLTILDIHANPEDKNTNVVYGRMEQGFIALGEYHGKRFARWISDLIQEATPEPIIANTDPASAGQ